MSNQSVDFKNSIEEDLVKMLRGKLNFPDDEEISRDNTNNSSEKESDQGEQEDKQTLTNEGENGKSRIDFDAILSEFRRSEEEFLKQESFICETEDKSTNKIYKPEAHQGGINSENKLQSFSSIINNNFEFYPNSFLQQNRQIPQIPKLNTLYFNNFNNYSFFSKFYDVFQGQFYSLCLSQNGSKLLQDYIQTIPSDILTKIFDEIKEYLPEIILSKYGNYFCRLLYLHIKFEEKLVVLNSLKQKFFQIATSSVGTYPLQSIIERVNSLEEKFILIECLKANEEFLLQMSMNEFSVHVIDKIIYVCDEFIAVGIYRFCFENFIRLALNKNGIFLIKRIISQTKSTVTKNKIFKIVSENFALMLGDAYANYAIQYMIEHWDDFYFSLIMKYFLGRISKLACQKFPSIVVEKILEKGGENVIRLFIYEISDMNNLNCLLNNKFGMYVIKKALNVSHLPSKMLILQAIENNLNLIKDKMNVISWLNICQYYRQIITQNMNSNLQYNGM